MVRAVSGGPDHSVDVDITAVGETDRASARGDCTVGAAQAEVAGKGGGGRGHIGHDQGRVGKVSGDHATS